MNVFTKLQITNNNLIINNNLISIRAYYNMKIRYNNRLYLIILIS